MDAHARIGEPADEIRRQVGGSPAVDGDVHLSAAPRRGDQRRMKLVAHLVVEQDERLQQDFLAGRCDDFEGARVELLSVLEQPDTVAVDPASAHSEISAASGAWSDRWDQGRLGSTSGECARALRT